MKISVKYLFVAVLAIASFSCKKDNYDAPSSTLSGHLLYQSDTIYLEKEQVPILVYQYGFGKVGPVGSVSSGTSVTPTFAQDGGYSLLLYDGDYKIVIPNGQGPFLWKKTATGDPDTVSVTLHGSQKVDLQVTPYYLVKSQQYTPTGRNLKFTFNAQKIITDANAKDIERVNVYVNKTQFVSGGDQIASREYSNNAIIDQSNIEFYKFISPQTPSSNSVFVRIGIKIAGVEDMIFSPVQRVELGAIDNYARIEPNGGTLYGGATIDSFENDKSHTYVNNISAVGSGIDIPFSISTAGTYVINIGGATEMKGSTQTVYIDGNTAAVQTPLYPQQGKINFDISPVQFQLSAGDHVLSIRKNAADVGQAQIDWIDVFRLVQ